MKGLLGLILCVLIAALVIKLLGVLVLVGTICVVAAVLWWLNRRPRKRS